MEGGWGRMFDGFVSPVIRCACLYLATGYTANAASTGLSHSPHWLLTAVANINLLLDAGLLIFNRPLAILA